MKNSAKNVSLFIDSMPYRIAKDVYKASPVLQEKFNLYPVVPTLGYSVNIKMEMFEGKTADDIGIYNEWSLSQVDRKFYFPFNFSWNAYLDAIVHKVVHKFICKVANIPFNLIKYFNFEAGFGELRGASLFEKNNVELFLSEKLTVKERDKEMVQIASKTIDEHKNSFVSLVDLDLLGHICGVGSKEYNEHIEYLSGVVDDYVSKFDNLVILSDHGMINTQKFINFKDIEKVVGKPSRSSYIYFIDSTIVRFWIYNEKLRAVLEGYLANKDAGAILTPEERKLFGITSEKFGDMIYVVNENVVIKPNFHGSALRVKAMHGYSSLSDDNKACIFVPKSTQQGLDVITCRDVYNILDAHYKK